MIKNILFILGILFILEFYVFQSFKEITERSLPKYLYWGITIMVYSTLLILSLSLSRANPNQEKIHWISSLFLVFVLPKIFVVLFLLLDDFIRFFEFGIGQLTQNRTAHYTERRKFLSVIGLGIFGIFGTLILDGIIFGKYRHQVRKVKIKINNLPQAFNGYRIIQFSDLHSGSFLHPEKLQKAFSLINAQRPDLILFTGDAVNNIASELEPFVPLLKNLYAKDGKFAVLGNHDYGMYMDWKSEEEKAQNVPKLIELQRNAGFTNLRNEHRIIERNGEKLYIIGVENWGIKPFPQYGDLDSATKNIPIDAAKILMSHDPTHFDEVVKKHSSNISLTLSGHTHGMQFGLDLKNIKWSPVQFKYKKWADLYESEGKYLYVNRGFGVIGYPGRVGIHPEITLFELQ